MKVIHVNLNQQSYDIRIGRAVLETVPEVITSLGYRGKAVLITNPLVRQLFGETLIANLEAAGFATIILEVAEGEKYKSLDEAGKLYHQLSEFQAERMTPVLALGGGVIGDLAGFVASTYMRGVPLFHLPTTLLSQVDSSIGGKTAVNYGQLKNNIGTFFQPKAVITDLDTLRTLSRQDYADGLAEIIKYGIIRDAELFHILQNNMEWLKTGQKKITEDVVGRCIAIKAEITAADEKDIGLRNILNFGHTVGHAIESVSNYRINHGRAVAMGIVAAATLSSRIGLLSIVELEEIRTVIKAAGLPVALPRLEIEKLVEAMLHDKKKVGGQVRFILLKSIGEVLVKDDINLEDLKQVLREMG